MPVLIEHHGGRAKFDFKINELIIDFKYNYENISKLTQVIEIQASKEYLQYFYKILCETYGFKYEFSTYITFACSTYPKNKFNEIQNEMYSVLIKLTNLNVNTKDSIKTYISNNCMSIKNVNLNLSKIQKKHYLLYKNKQFKIENFDKDCYVCVKFMYRSHDS